MEEATKEAAAVAEVKPIVLHRVVHAVKVGGSPVGVTRVKGGPPLLSIAGEQLSVAQWLETRRGIDMILRREMTDERWKELREQMAWLGKRDRLPSELRDYEATRTGTVTSFLEQNLDAINTMPRGRIKPSPWWLRWLYPHIITNESLQAEAVTGVVRG